MNIMKLIVNALFDEEFIPAHTGGRRHLVFREEDGKRRMQLMIKMNKASAAPNHKRGGCIRRHAA